MSGNPFVYEVAGNLNDVADVPWPVFPDTEWYRPQVAEQEALEVSRRSVASECARLLTDAWEAWTRQEREAVLVASGWTSAEMPPASERPVWVILHEFGGSGALRNEVWLSHYTPVSGWWDVADDLVAYWYPVTLPPGPVTVGWESRY